MGRNINMIPRNPLQTVIFLDNARKHVAYEANTAPFALAEWILFNARAMVRAEAAIGYC